MREMNNACFDPSIMTFSVQLGLMFRPTKRKRSRPRKDKNEPAVEKIKEAGLRRIIAL
jgi:hypothetical protein